MSVLSPCRTRPLSAASVGSLLIQDRLNQLVGLFKGRTERQRERLVDPDESEEDSPSACMTPVDTSHSESPRGQAKVDEMEKS